MPQLILKKKHLVPEGMGVWGEEFGDWGLGIGRGKWEDKTRIEHQSNYISSTEIFV